MRPVGVDRIGDQVEFAGAAAGGDALEMRGDGVDAGRIVNRVGAGALVQDIAVCLAVHAGVGEAAGDAVGPHAVGRGADGERLVDLRVGAARDVVEEGISRHRLGVVVAHDLVAEGAVGDRLLGRVAGRVGKAERRDLLPGRRGAVIEKAEVERRRSRGRVAADDAQDAGRRAEGRTVGRGGGRPGEIDSRRGRHGKRLEGAGREAIEQPARRVAGAGAGGVVAGHVVAADAGDAGEIAAAELQRRVGGLLRHRRGRDQCSRAGCNTR